MGQLRSRKGPDNIVACKNTTGVTIAAKVAVMREAASDEIKLPAATTSPIFGVTMEAIEDGKWGSVQTGPSLAIVTAGAALATIGTKLMVGTNGKAVAYSASSGVSANVLGTSNTVASGSDVDLEVELAPPYTVHQAD